MSYIYNPLIKQGFQKIIKDNLDSVNNTIYVSKSGSDVTGNGSRKKPFLTIKKGVDISNTLVSLSNPICVFIESGEYYEDSITLSNNVYITGQSQDSVVVRPNNVNNVLFTCSDLNAISFLTIIGVTNSAAIYTEDASENILLHKVYFINCYTSVRMYAINSDSYVYLEYVSVDNPIYNAFEVITSSFYCEVSAENTYVYNVTSQSSYADVVCNGENSMFIFHSGSIVNQFNVGGGIGFYSINGGSYKIRNTQIEGYNYGIRIENGTNPNTEIIGNTFADNNYNFFINGDNCIGYFSGYTEYSKYYINPNSTFFITNKDPRIIKVSKTGGDFTSVKDAIDSITDNSSTKIYTINIGPGIFIEDTITMKPYVNVVGESITSTIIEINATSKDTIIATGNSGLFKLQLRGSTDTGKSAIINDGTLPGVFRCNEVRFGSNYSFYKQTSLNGVTVSIFNSCSAESTSNFSIAFDISSNGSTLSTMALNSFIYTGNGSTFIKAYGLGTQLSLANFTISKSNMLGYGVHIYNGTNISLNSVLMQGFDKAIYNENTGTGINIYTGGLSLRNNTIDIELNNPNTTGSINGFCSQSKVIIDPLINISLLFTDVTGLGTVSLGELWLGNKYNEIYNAKNLIESNTLGLLEGGILSDGGLHLLNVSEGFGYLEDTTGITDVYKRFDWNNQSINLSANLDVYVYINTNGILSYDTTRPDTISNILLGRCVTNSIEIEYIEQAKFDAHHIGNKISNTLRNVFGTIFASGGLSQTNLSREIEVIPGKYYLGEIEINLNGKTYLENFTPIYRNTVPGEYLYLTNTNIILNNSYDDNSGTLQTLTIGEPFAKHFLYVTNNGSNDKYYLVISQNKYSTIDDAITAPNPNIPSWFKEHTVGIAAIITDFNDSTFTQVIDIRPRPLFASNSSSGVSAHGSLSGLSNDDHPQYFLVNGLRPFSGNLDLGNNNINNVNLVDGVKVSTHAARHLPNGLDSLATAAPLTTLSNLTTNDVGTANSFSRSDHTHAITIAGNLTTGLLTTTDWNTFNNKLSASDVFVNNIFDYRKLPNYHVENFLEINTGVIIYFNYSTASGGTVTTEIPESQPNWNGTTAYPRLGQASHRITTAANSRAGGSPNTNFRLYNNAEFLFASELSILGGQINFSTDPVLLCWGYLNTTSSNPTNGMFFRPPRVGETNFLKYVIRIAGIDTVADTSIVYDSTNRRFIRTILHWTGTDLIFTALDDTNISVNTISNLLTTYPSLGTLNISYGHLVIRTNTASAPIARNLNVDKVERYIKNNF